MPNDAVIVVKRDQLNELANLINNNSTDGNSTIYPFNHPLEAFHRMVDLSFTEVTFSINPGSTAVTVAARGTHKRVAYSDLGLANKTNKVAFNTQGKLFYSIFEGGTVEQSTALKRLTKNLKDAFSTKESPFKNYMPIFKCRIPKDKRAKQDALKKQVPFNDNLHGHKSDDGKVWLKINDEKHDPEEFDD